MLVWALSRCVAALLIRRDDRCCRAPSSAWPAAAVPRDRAHAGVGTARGDLSGATLHPSCGTREGSRRAGCGLAAAAAATHACGGRGGRAAAAAHIRGHAGVGTARGDLSDATLHPRRGIREGSRRAGHAASPTHACSCHAKLALAALAEGRCEYVVRGKEEGEGEIGRRVGKFTYTSSVRRGRR